MDYEFPYEQAAINCEPLPNGLTGMNVLTYYALCYPYKLYDKGKGTITREQGGKMKRKIMSALNEATEMLQKYHNMWKKIESVSYEYAQNPSIENADRFYAAVYNLPDDWRLNR